MRRVLIVCAVGLAGLTGCMKHNIQHYSQVDPTEKSVTVPAGASGLKGKLKQLLAEEGWRMSVDVGPSVIEGRAGENVRLESYDSFNTRYRLHVASSRYDTCMNLQPAIFYEISFIDNKTGGEVFTIEGKGCEGGAISRFREAITGVAR